RQLPRTRHHLHRRSPVRRRRAAPRHGAAACRAHRPHGCGLAGDALMTETEPDKKVETEKVAPETLELRARPQPVTRINRKVVFGGAAVVLLLVAFLVLVALQTPKLQVGAPRELINVENKPIAESLARLPATYEGVRPEKSPEPPRPPSGIPQLTEPVSDPIDQAEQVERARLARMARESQVFFRLQLRPSQESAARSEAGSRPPSTTAANDTAGLAALRTADQTRALVAG